MRIDVTVWQQIKRLSGLAIVGIFALSMVGCASKPKTPPRPPMMEVLRATHHLGGTHYRTIVHNGVWYQTFSSSLLLVDGVGCTALKTIELGRLGETGPAIDMAALDSKLYVVIEDDGVIELSISNPRHPEVIRQIDARTLGLRPRRVSVVDGEVCISGAGGVVRLSDRARMLDCQDDVRCVVSTSQGVVACVGSECKRLGDQEVAGAASDLQPLPNSFGVPGAIVSVLQEDRAARVGLLSPDLTPLPETATSILVSSTVRAVRPASGLLWVVSDQGVVGYGVTRSALSEVARCDILGARDVGELNQNHLAIAGTFGRAVFRIRDDERGKGQTVVAMVREPSRLERADTDGQHILAGGPEGHWMYLINSRVEPLNRGFERTPPPPLTRAATVRLQAQIIDEGKAVRLSGNWGETSVAADGAATPSTVQQASSESLQQGRIHCLAAVDGDIWLGHDRGVSVLRLQPDNTISVAGHLRLEGPIIYLYPLLIGGGASYVSHLGGFGVAAFVKEPIAEAPRR